MLEALQYPFFQRALLAGVLVSLLAGFLSPLVVQRRLAYLGDGLAHAAFAGVALGLLLGWAPLPLALGYALLVALGITYVVQKGGLPQDSAIGVFFAFSAALGAVFLSRARGYVGDPLGYLFGSLLAVTPGDLLALGGLGLLALPLVFLWGRLAYAAFDRELAQADRLPVALYDYLLALFLALALVVAVKVVGALLAAAFLVIPGATARLLASRFSAMALWSVALALAAALLGLGLSYLLDWPSGGSVVLVQAGLFLLAFVKSIFSGPK